jgi:predicted membrane-bound spermidine synthase
MPTRLPLYALVFTAGLVTLSMELAASRLLEPVFGNSQLVWAALIGLILLYLALGAWLGGIWADRYPHRAGLERVLTAAGVAVALVPLAASPVLGWAAAGMEGLLPSVLGGALLVVVLLFALPGILLGTATPWALRLALGAGPDAARHSGQLAGRFSAVATLGSLVGSFLPVLWLIPTYGTRRTFFLLALLLLAVVTLSALGSRRWWLPLTAFAGVLALMLTTGAGGVRAGWDSGAAGRLIFEQESAFNYIAVRQWGSERHLKLNDGIGIHSVYHPDSLLSLGIWDYFLLAPLFRSHPADDPAPANLLLIGAAAGTVPALYQAIYGPVPVTGVELDPAIIAAGERYFDAGRLPAYTAIAADGRRWLAQQPVGQQYDIIAVDAYRPPYIPFHLTTAEFFQLIRSHLSDSGVLAINVGRTPTNFALIDALAVTLAPYFASVVVVDEPGPPDTLGNSLLVATVQPVTVAQVQRAAALLPVTLPGEFRDFAAGALAAARPANPPAGAPRFTDDHSQVEQLVHGLIVDFLVGP